jgi:hypothetical protein
MFRLKLRENVFVKRVKSVMKVSTRPNLRDVVLESPLKMETKTKLNSMV